MAPLPKGVPVRFGLWSLIFLLSFGWVSLAPAGDAKGALEGKLLVTAPARPPEKSETPTTALYGYAAQYASKTPPLPEEVVVYLVKVPGQWTPPKKHARLDQKYTRFTHRVLAVLVGTLVDFTNNDPVYHNIFSNSDLNEFDLGRRKRGETITKRMAKVEVPVHVYCEIHRKMKANLLVLQNPFFAVVRPGGSFKLEGIPPGKYVLAAWHDYWEPVQTTVEVKAGKTVKADLTLAKVQ